MGIIGIHSVIMTTTDLDEMRRFFTDWGLNLEDATADELVFATELGSRVILRAADKKGLPVSSSGHGQSPDIIWGVSDEAALDRIEKVLGGSCPVSRDVDGALRTRDPNDIGLGFRVWADVKAPKQMATPYNTAGGRPRVDRAGALYDRARPMRIGHVVFLVADLPAAEAFYTQRLGFRVSDRYGADRAVFLRCSAENDHHNLFLLNTHGAKTELQHIAFEVRDIHEVFGGGIAMRQKGWATDIGPGRHPVSSAYFWYFKNPAGGAVEYFSDTDYVTDAWAPRTFAEPRFSEWHVADGVGPTAGGQVEKTAAS